MTHAQYWDGDPWLTAVYRQAHMKRMEMRSQEMWMQGLYNFHALSAALGNFGNALSGRRRAHKPHEYLKEPIRITPLTEDEKKEKRKEAVREQYKKWRAVDEMLKARKKK